MRKISKVRKELRNVGHLGQGLPEVTLKETKECFRRGVEKLPLQALAKWRVVHTHEKQLFPLNEQLPRRMDQLFR